MTVVCCAKFKFLHKRRALGQYFYVEKHCPKALLFYGVNDMSKQFTQFLRYCFRFDGVHTGIGLIFTFCFEAAAAGMGADDKFVPGRQRPVNVRLGWPPEGQRPAADGVGNMQGAGITGEQQFDCL